MNQALIFVGLGTVGFGVLHALYPESIARFEMRTKAIGSKRSWSEVEPTEWKIALTQFGGGVLLCVGLLVLTIAV